MNAADRLVYDVQEMGVKQQSLQTNYIKNENRVTKATEAALKAKSQADKANTELYQLNNGFKNVSGALDTKTTTIGSAKDLAVDLQRRANDLAAQASNKLSFLSGKKTLSGTERAKRAEPRLSPHLSGAIRKKWSKKLLWRANRAFGDGR